MSAPSIPEYGGRGMLAVLLVRVTPRSRPCSQVTLRMGQANVRRWVDDIMPLLEDADPLGTEQFATHHVSLEDAPQAYADFQHKAHDTVKVVFRP